MILINLLPHREAARHRRREAFNLFMGLAALLGGLLAGTVFLWYQGRLSDEQDKINVLQTENKKLDIQIKDLAGLRAEIAALRARQQAVEDLQSDRNLPVHMLNELVKQLPEGVFLKSMRQEGQNVTLQGVAQSNERISELLRNLANNTPWLSRPDLVEIVADNVTIAPRDIRRVAKFNLRVRLMRTTEAEKALLSPAGASAAKGAVPKPVAASAPAKL